MDLYGVCRQYHRRFNRTAQYCFQPCLLLLVRCYKISLDGNLRTAVWGMTQKPVRKTGTLFCLSGSVFRVLLRVNSTT